MKKHSVIVAVALICGIWYGSLAEETVETSKIISVKLYQNQATIVRQARLKLEKGLNTVVISNLSPLLYDWSVRGSLPAGFGGKINSIEVEQKALVQKRQRNIVTIEEKLEGLREKDQVCIDELKNINSQEKFLNSILEFTNATVSKELATRIPQISLWDNTLEYVSTKMNNLLREKRKIEKEREKIGKEIQKWEFELSQIAGTTYFRNYQTLNKAILDNRSALNIQQYAGNTGEYGEKKRLFKNPTEKVDIEKRLNVSIYSPENTEIDLNVSYVIPETRWQMKYDIRASGKKKNAMMVIYGDIYQKTGENWENISLSLSTGAPINTISPPELRPWYLDLEPTYREESTGRKDKKYASEMTKRVMPVEDEKQKEEEYQTTIREEGSYFAITIPSKQNIASSTKYQKKYVKEYELEGENKVRFYYELTPEKTNNAFLKATLKNSTELPWLDGEAQIFLENEFMGKVAIPFTPPGKDRELVLGTESRITALKELVKKYEETAGALGGKRRIKYSYKVTIENQLPRSEDLVITDAFPVSRNEKIKLEIENISVPFMKDEEFEKSTPYSQGIRKWKLAMEPHAKKVITYDIIITFDKENRVWGIR
ncbi:MAG: DUF4139 domain-containing protein [Spirochaetes bacterium]|nr:DUF4139 domain-containing protein [Spirochaetota bacterium]